MGQLLVQFPGPIRFSLSRPRNRRLHVLDWITLQLFFFLMALTTSYAPGWSSWLPPWIFLFIFLGMIGMLFSWLFHWLPYRFIAWGTSGGLYPRGRLEQATISTRPCDAILFI
jgi:energy-coupling factor transporter transmembrane protein EcfT